MPDKAYKVVVADSQYLVTESLKKLIAESDKYCLIGVVEYLFELNELLRKESFDLLITDFATMDYNGFESISGMVQTFPDMGILILTNQVLKHDFNELNKSGIKNIICKTTGKDELFMAMDATIRRRKFYSEEVLEIIMDEPKAKPKSEEIHLTATETEIVKMIAEGMTTKEIAANKNISFHTVMTHRKNIFRKLSVNSSSELIMYAIRAGWIDNIEYYI
ncbi:LuxR C-terminal-related transcriptional regulator [Alkalitalea saponilacus]|uniref:Two component transcriptional regulator, LuxR family n=1 Tax=Alkalitalea saponilacus TaxID=889453 RepID=A0A1T5HK98_9BACT|nr:response regulator transcription factor [Alkalitalea saponilacus]ASB47764.1 DNA-binding response regulator [Alkalitalea saponilacus]SKC21097.1 two component transcriptional regulator, LuxR family [Alkalitalea saponilacus]